MLVLAAVTVVVVVARMGTTRTSDRSAPSRTHGTSAESFRFAAVSPPLPAFAGEGSTQASAPARQRLAAPEVASQPGPDIGAIHGNVEFRFTRPSVSFTAIATSLEPSGTIQEGRRTTVGADRTFQLDAIPPGRWRVALEPGDGATSEEASETVAMATNVDVAPAATTEVTLRARGGALQVTVVDEIGTPLHGADARMFSKPRSNEETSFSIWMKRSSSEGVVWVHGLEGEHHVVVNAPERATFVEPVTIARGLTSEVTARLVRGAFVRITARAVDGTKLRSFTLLINDSPFQALVELYANPAAGVSRRDGLRLAPGRWRLAVAASGYLPKEVVVDVASDPAPPIEVVLEPKPPSSRPR